MPITNHTDNKKTNKELIVKKIMESNIPTGEPKTKEEAERQLEYHVNEMNRHFKAAKDIKKYILPKSRAKIK